MLRRIALLAALALAAACSADKSTPKDSTEEPAAETPDAGSETQPQVGAGAPFKTYVILGDSISDEGGEGPFFYDLLGDDLKEKLGVTVEKHSKSGALSKGLASQIKAIPEALDGPVAITVTIGGNDMQVAALDILNGKDEAQRAAYVQNVTAAYDDLLTEDRFGSGVKVTIFHATIYDPTDGKGNFAAAGCPSYLAAIPEQPTAAYWDAWNKDATDALAKYGANLVVVDARKKFEGHGVGTSDSWFFSDCIHPNKEGHEGLHQLFLGAIAP